MRSMPNHVLQALNEVVCWLDENFTLTKKEGVSYGNSNIEAEANKAVKDLLK